MLGVQSPGPRSGRPGVRISPTTSVRSEHVLTEARFPTSTQVSATAEPLGRIVPTAPATMLRAIAAEPMKTTFRAERLIPTPSLPTSASSGDCLLSSIGLGLGPRDSAQLHPERTVDMRRGRADVGSFIVRPGVCWRLIRRAGLRPGPVARTSRPVRRRCQLRRPPGSAAPCPVRGAAARRWCRPAWAHHRCW